MDQAVGMHALQRTGGALQAIGFDPQHGPGLEHEEGAKALARAQGGIAHGLRQATLGAFHAGQQG